MFFAHFMRIRVATHLLAHRDLSSAPVARAQYVLMRTLSPHVFLNNARSLDHAFQVMACHPLRAATPEGKFELVDGALRGGLPTDYMDVCRHVVADARFSFSLHA